ncbi:hypothetical protein OG21DRAFT_1254452 [Imleria badia]|nr:hypothetical protein OG21DRAFT_1254452 [Imleria badia]
MQTNAAMNTALLPQGSGNRPCSPSRPVALTRSRVECVSEFVTGYIQSLDQAAAFKYRVGKERYCRVCASQRTSALRGIRCTGPSVSPTPPQLLIQVSPPEFPN